MSWSHVIVAGFAGFGLGIGLVAGAFVVRTLRHYMKDDE
jgi:hypothetical protein